MGQCASSGRAGGAPREAVDRACGPDVCSAPTGTAATNGGLHDDSSPAAPFCDKNSASKDETSLQIQAVWEPDHLATAAMLSSPTMQTIISADILQVLYQNSASLAYAGCWTSTGQSSSTYLQALLTLQPPELMHELLEAVVVGRHPWTRVVQVPSSLPGAAANSSTAHLTLSQYVTAADTDPCTNSSGIAAVWASHEPSSSACNLHSRLGPSSLGFESQRLSGHLTACDGSTPGPGGSCLSLPRQPSQPRRRAHGSISWLEQEMSTAADVDSSSGRLCSPMATLDPNGLSAAWPGTTPRDASLEEPPKNPSRRLARSTSVNGDRSPDMGRQQPEQQPTAGDRLKRLGSKSFGGSTRRRLVQLLNSRDSHGSGLFDSGEHASTRVDLRGSVTNDHFPRSGLVRSTHWQHTDEASGVCSRGVTLGAAVGQDGPLWHEVTITPFTEPRTGQQLLLVAQTDVTERSKMEQRLMQMTEVQLYMLENMFPRHILEQLAISTVQASTAQGPHSMLATIKGLSQAATHHDCVTIMFTDIVGFTTMSKAVQPEQVMTFLNQLFSRFDELVTKHKVSKVETAGDCFIVCAGLLQEDEEGFHALAVEGQSVSRTRAARRVLNFAAEMMQVARGFKMPNGQPVQQRAGLHSGPVAAGLIGQLMPKFSLFGDTMNTASRMESTSIPGHIQVSEDTYRLLQDKSSSWQCTGGVEVKGKGLMNTYLLRKDFAPLHLEREDSSFAQLLDTMQGFESMAGSSTLHSRLECVGEAAVPNAADIPGSQTLAYQSFEWFSDMLQSQSGPCVSSRHSIMHKTSSGLGAHSSAAKAFVRKCSGLGA